MTKAPFPTVIDFDILCPHFRGQGRRKIQGKKNENKRRQLKLIPIAFVQ